MVERDFPKVFSLFLRILLSITVSFPDQPMSKSNDNFAKVGITRVVKLRNKPGSGREVVDNEISQTQGVQGDTLAI